MRERPEKLFHYTNLQSLALILKNETIRLMPLTGLDDPQENQTADIQNLGRFFFASCWTSDSDESIPMWNMYASLESGVRISLPPCPFKRYKGTQEGYAVATGLPIDHICIEGEQYTFLPIKDLASGIMSPQALNGNGILQKIIYTDDKSLLEPKISSDDSWSLDFGNFGKVKNTKWEFQHEWRYLMLIIPFDVFGQLDNLPERFANVHHGIVCGSLPSACPYYDLKIDHDLLSQIEIVPSPKMSSGNRVLLDSLLKQYGMSGRIMKSELIGLL